MNSIQRVMASLSGQQTDRRAISLTLSLYGAKLTGCPLDEYYTNPTAYAQGQSAVLRTFGPDILFGPFALCLEGQSFGSRVRFFKDQAPTLYQPALASADMVNRLTAPDVDTHPVLVYFRRAVQTMAAEHGQQVPICAITLDPFSLPAMIMGLDGWLNTLLFDQEAAKKILEVTSRHFIRWVKALAVDGASFVILPAVLVIPHILTRQMAEQIALPALREAFSQVNVPLIIHSTGAPLVPFIDLFAGLPQVAGFLLNCGDSFDEARRKIGPAMTLIGNVEGPTLKRRSPEEIKAECKRILFDRRDDPRFILGTSAADIAFDTPMENILAIGEAAESFRKR